MKGTEYILVSHPEKIKKLKHLLSINQLYSFLQFHSTPIGRIPRFM
jgi:hypothetical protein